MSAGIVVTNVEWKSLGVLEVRVRVTGSAPLGGQTAWVVNPIGFDGFAALSGAVHVVPS